MNGFVMHLNIDTNKEYHIKRKGTLPKMRAERFGEVEYLTFPDLCRKEEIKHLFTTRRGGVSEGIFSTMNVSYTRGDRKEAVDENYTRIGEIFSLSIGDFVCSDQTHTTNIRIVTEEDRGKGTIREKDYTDVDGLVTDCENLILATFYADCVPLFFVDEKRKVVGLAHSGWRGTVGGIGAKMTKIFKETYQSSLEDIRVAIGPSICQDCYEVSEDVAVQFRNKFSDRQEQEAILLAKGNGKYQLNLWEANRLILKKAGILEENIIVTDICTCCNPDYLFSHRASEGKRGNLGAFIGILRKN